MQELKLTEERIFFSVPVQEQDRPEAERGCITHYTIQCYGLDRKRASEQSSGGEL